MTQTTSTQPTVHDMLKETQGYRTSLESLMSIGRGLLANPSMEDDSAAGFKILTEEVLEQADHHGDMVAVDGVSEPAAVVELIMQDVLTPRLTEVEQIERALQEKAEKDEPVPFTTRHAMTEASMESAFKCEILNILRNNIQNVKTIASLENMPVDTVRPMVVSLAGLIGPAFATTGVSMESLGETQVLGDLSDAVQRMEDLVNKAHEAASEQMAEHQQEGAAIGADGEDRLGDVIESHRDEAGTGAQLAEGTNVSSVPNDTPSSNEGGDDLGGDTAGTEGEGLDGENTNELIEPDDFANEGDDVDGEEELTDAEGSAEEPLTGEGEGGTDDEDGEEENDEEEEEEGDDLSLESMSDPIVIVNLTEVVEGKEMARDNVATLFDACDGLNLLTVKGKEQLAAGIDLDTSVTSDMFVPETADVLVRNYSTWAAAAQRDGGANVRALLALVNN